MTAPPATEFASRRCDPPVAVILAAGAGRRLGELGKRHSKAMLPLASRPLIDHVIERLRAGGAGRFVVVAHPDDRPLADFLAAKHAEAQLVPQPKRLGIADALCRALPLLRGEGGYLACACDSLFQPGDIRAVVDRGRESAGEAVVAVIEMGVAATLSRSAVQLQGDLVRALIEKPKPEDAPSGTVAAPLYWLPERIAPFLAGAAGAGGESYVTTALQEFIRAGGTVRAVRVAERLEVTTADDLSRVASLLTKARDA